MFDTAIHVIGPAAAAVIIYGTGVCLTRSGRPFNAVLLAVHKLLSLVFLIFVGVLVYKAIPLTSTDWTFVASAAVLSIVSFTSGGILAILEKAPSCVLWSHRIGVWLNGIVIALCLIRIA